LALPVHPTIILLRKPRNGVSIEKKKLRGRNVALHTLRVLALLLSYYALRPYGLVVSNFSPLAFGLGFDPWLCRFTPHRTFFDFRLLRRTAGNLNLARILT
jgi:hypothetical protein